VTKQPERCSSGTRRSLHAKKGSAMPSERIDPLQEDGTQCAVILQVLRDDHQQPWTLAEIEQELADVDPDAIVVALARLEEQGVVLRDGKHISASPCARHLNALGFICI
jgi:hypothetical protein